MAGRALLGKTAVVTGGSSGIGAATVAALATEGAEVAIGYNRGADCAEALRFSLPGRNHRVARIPLEDAGTHAHLRTATGTRVVIDGGFCL